MDLFRKPTAHVSSRKDVQSPLQADRAEDSDVTAERTRVDALDPYSRDENVSIYFFMTNIESNLKKILCEMLIV